MSNEYQNSLENTQEHEHHHGHEESCGCGHEHHEHEHHHEHGEECGCEHEHHEHGHHHEHGEECGCEHEHHEHEHHHEHGEECGCGHEHHEHEHHHEPEHTPVTKAPMKIYIVDNLDCANCAAKIERKIQSLPGVEFASITFATKQLRVAAKNQKALLPLMQEACKAIEPDAVITPREELEKDSGGDDKAESRKDLICIGIGAVLFLAGKLAERFSPIASLILFIDRKSVV